MRGSTGAKRRRSSGFHSINFDENFMDDQDAVENLKFQPKSLKGGVLTEHQIEGLNWMIDLYECEANGLLADQMGLGKTIQALSLLAFLKDKEKIDGPHIIIAPLSTIQNWKNEADKWVPGFKSVILRATYEEREECLEKYVNPQKFDILITSYEGMSFCLPELQRIRFKFLILDEAHKIKNHESKFSQDIRKMKCKNKLLLTGTPIHNNIYELWSLLNYIMPKLFFNEQIFIDFFGDEEDKQKEKEIIC